MELQKLFIQKIEHLRTGEEIDLAFLQSITFVETMDLSGPKLMLEFDDPHSILRDEVGVVEQDEIRLTMSDDYNRDGIDEVIDFTILTKTVSGNHIKINAIAAAVYVLKKRAISAMVFASKSPSFILSRMFPGKKYSVGKFPVIEDYHLLVGEYPSYLLRQMAREQGGHVYLRRDTACLHRLSDIMSMEEPDFEYHHNDPSEGNQIVNPTVPSTQHVLEDKLVRRQTGWSMTKGWLSVGSASLPPVMTSSQSKFTMKNIVKSPKPVVDFMCVGNGFLTAGACLDLIWHTNRRDLPIDESLPDRVVAFSVAHQYRANKYFCRVKGCVPLEAS